MSRLEWRERATTQRPRDDGGRKRKEGIMWRLESTTKEVDIIKGRQKERCKEWWKIVFGCDLGHLVGGGVAVIRDALDIALDQREGGEGLVEYEHLDLVDRHFKHVIALESGSQDAASLIGVVVILGQKLTACDQEILENSVGGLETYYRRRHF